MCPTFLDDPIYIYCATLSRLLLPQQVLEQSLKNHISATYALDLLDAVKVVIYLIVDFKV